MKRDTELFRDCRKYGISPMAFRIVATKWLNSKKVTTGADDSPRFYDTWLQRLIEEIEATDVPKTTEP
jgi:hypothetical protein